MAGEAERFRAAVERQAGSDEDVDAILGDVQALAEERARRLGRQPTPADAEYFLSMFCWNPLKPDPAPSVQGSLQRIRRTALAAGIGLREYVSDDALTWSESQLYDAQQQSVELFLNEQEQAET